MELIWVTLDRGITKHDAFTAVYRKVRQYDVY